MATKRLIQPHPNTYTFTKGMAERSLKKNFGHLKVAIIRPSIIISTLSDPFPGWTDTLSAGGGIMYAITSGLIRYVRSDS